jgi:hypothetical protein
MKIPSLFTKTPNYKRFAYNPRHYVPQKKERQEREERIRGELIIILGTKENIDNLHDYHSRIVGLFHPAKKTAIVQKDPSSIMLQSPYYYSLLFPFKIQEVHAVICTFTSGFSAFVHA